MRAGCQACSGALAWLVRALVFAVGRDQPKVAGFGPVASILRLAGAPRGVAPSDFPKGLAVASTATLQIGADHQGPALLV